MFLSQERRRRNEFKQFKNRANYFRSYNQQTHRQEYLKEYSKVRRLLTKYNPAYQDKRKGDRHKLTYQNRYRTKILTQELKKRGWTEINNIKNRENLSSLPFFFFNVALVEKKFSLTSLSCKSFFFDIPTQGQTHQQKQDAYLFSYLIQKENKQLRELLAKKPQLFSKKLKEIEQASRVVNVHWKKQDIIQTINQVPQERNWQLSTRWEKQDLSALLLKYQEDRYDLRNRNCEHLANVLVYGINYSKQVEDNKTRLSVSVGVPGGIVAGGFTGAGLWGFLGSIALAPATGGASLLLGAASVGAAGVGVAATLNVADGYAEINNGKGSTIKLTNEMNESNDKLGERSNKLADDIKANIEVLPKEYCKIM